MRLRLLCVWEEIDQLSVFINKRVNAYACGFARSQADFDEVQYLKEYLLLPIEKAREVAFQTELERWAHQVEDAFEEIDKRLAARSFLLGDEPAEADKLLYQTLLRHDHIYYYLYKLNITKSTDYKNIARYREELGGIPEIAESIQIEKEREQAYRELDDARNPYHLIARGPEE